jgi:hypothetical protein
MPFRLKPGQDLKTELEAIVASHEIKAGFILTCVGSLSRTRLRLAGLRHATEFEGNLEILSLSGTLSPDGLHLHISLADADGKTIGGHVMDGCLVHTTAEILIGVLSGVGFSREKDENTGYYELVF